MSNQSDTSHHPNAQARVYQPDWMILSHQSQTSQFDLHTIHSTPQQCHEESSRQYRETETSGTEHKELRSENVIYLAEEHELDRFGMQQRNHNGLVIEGETPQTVSGKVSFKQVSTHLYTLLQYSVGHKLTSSLHTHQILEQAMSNVSDQLMALLEEELDNMEEESEEMEEELPSTQRDSKL